MPLEGTPYDEDHLITVRGGKIVRQNFLLFTSLRTLLLHTREILPVQSSFLLCKSIKKN